MAVEKVNLHIKREQTQEAERILQNDKQTSFQKEIKTDLQIQEAKINLRTQRAINEILAYSENDRTLEKINQTDGRNRSEQASYLGKTSQFVRDILRTRCKRRRRQFNRSARKPERFTAACHYNARLRRRKSRQDFK